MPKFNMNVYKKKEVPFEKDFGHNKDLRREVLKSILPELEKAGIHYTEDQIEEIISNEKKLAAFNKAQAYMANISKRQEILREFKKNYGISFVGPYDRVAYCKMKLPRDGASKEEIERIHKENKEIFLKYSDPRNAEKLFREDVEYCLNYDLKKLINSTTEEATDLVLNDPNIEIMFVFYAMFNSSRGNFQFTPEFMNFIFQSKLLIEDGAEVQDKARNAGSAIAMLMPEKMDFAAAMTITGNRTLTDIIQGYFEKGVTGITSNTYKKDDGLAAYLKKWQTLSLTDPEIQKQIRNEIIDQNGGKSFFHTVTYKGKSLVEDIDNLAAVRSGLKAYERLSEPNLSDEDRLMLQQNIDAAKGVVNLKKENDPLVIKKALEDYNRNYKFNFEKITKDYVDGILSHITVHTHYPEVMAAEMRDFASEKKQGHTTLAEEIKLLSERHCTKEDTGDLLRTYGVLKNRIDNRRWYEKLFFHGRIRKQDEQMAVLTEKIEESGHKIGDFNLAYNSMLTLNSVDKIRQQEGIPDSGEYRDDFLKNQYHVRSERYRLTRDVAPEKIVEIDAKAQLYSKENHDSEMRQKAMDEQLQKMYDEDPELKELVEKKYDHDEGMKEKEPENEDINTNSNQGMKEKDDVINL